MLKIWWGTFWRLAVIWVVFSIPLMLLYSLIEPTDLSIKIKPTVFYLFIAFLMLLLSNLKKINVYVWKRIIPEAFAITITLIIAALAFLSSLLNLALIFSVSTEQWINAKMSLGLFMFVITPLIASIIINYKQSNDSDIDAKT